MARHEERDESYDLLNHYLQEISQVARPTPEREPLVRQDRLHEAREALARLKEVLARLNEAERKIINYEMCPRQRRPAAYA